MGNDYFSTLIQEANHMSPKLQASFDAFRNDLRSAILNEELPMTFEPYDGTCDGYWATVTVKVCNGFTLRMTIDEDYVSYGMDTWLSGLFEGESFEALKNLVRKYVNELSEIDRLRIQQLEAEIKQIKMKKAS